MKRRVLMIDDNKQMLEELSEIFQENRIELLRAETAQEALAIAQDNDFDVAVVDMRLPDYNGVNLIDKLKEQHPSSIYLLVTGYASVESAIKSLQKGILDYLVKPFSPEELLNSIKKGFLIKDRNEVAEERMEELLKEKCLLQAKVLVLEQYNEIFINREKKIIELKKEVNRLLKELKKDAKYIL